MEAERRRSGGGAEAGRRPLLPFLARSPAAWRARGRLVGQTCASRLPFGPPHETPPFRPPRAQRRDLRGGGLARALSGGDHTGVYWIGHRGYKPGAQVAAAEREREEREREREKDGMDWKSTLSMGAIPHRGRSYGTGTAVILRPACMCNPCVRTRSRDWERVHLYVSAVASRDAWHICLRFVFKYVIIKAIRGEMLKLRSPCWVRPGRALPPPPYALDVRGSRPSCSTSSRSSTRSSDNTGKAAVITKTKLFKHQTKRECNENQDHLTSTTTSPDATQPRRARPAAGAARIALRPRDHAARSRTAVPRPPAAAGGAM